MVDKFRVCSSLGNGPHGSGGCHHIVVRIQLLHLVVGPSGEMPDGDRLAMVQGNRVPASDRSGFIPAIVEIVGQRVSVLVRKGHTEGKLLCPADIPLYGLGDGQISGRVVVILAGIGGIGRLCVVHGGGDNRSFRDRPARMIVSNGVFSRVQLRHGILGTVGQSGNGDGLTALEGDPSPVRNGTALIAAVRVGASQRFSVGVLQAHLDFKRGRPGVSAGDLLFDGQASGPRRGIRVGVRVNRLIFHCHQHHGREQVADVVDTLCLQVLTEASVLGIAVVSGYRGG